MEKRKKYYLKLLLAFGVSSLLAFSPIWGFNLQEFKPFTDKVAHFAFLLAIGTILTILVSIFRDIFTGRNLFETDKLDIQNQKEGYTKDNRIDKVLQQKGYVLEECNIFYSPITVYIYYFGLFLSLSVGLIIENMNLLLDYWMLVIAYFLASYLVNSFFNNSVVVHKDQIIIVNPNFPFSRFESYNFSQIQKLEIRKSYSWLWTCFFMIFSSNQIQIQLQKSTKKFYCIYLQEDYFDENLIELTLDDLTSLLDKKGLNIDVNI